MKKVAVVVSKMAKLKKIAYNLDGVNIDCYLTEKEFNRYNRFKRSGNKEKYLQSIGIQFLMRDDENGESYGSN